LTVETTKWRQASSFSTLYASKTKLEFWFSWKIAELALSNYHLPTHSLKKIAISSVPFEFDKCYNEPLVWNCLFVQYILQKPVQHMACVRCLIFWLYILLWNSSFVLLAYKVEKLDAWRHLVVSTVKRHS
jgi:hypothetical protein